MLEWKQKHQATSIFKTSPLVFIAETRVTLHSIRKCVKINRNRGGRMGCNRRALLVSKNVGLYFCLAFWFGFGARIADLRALYESVLQLFKDVLHLLVIASWAIVWLYSFRSREPVFKWLCWNIVAFHGLNLNPFELCWKGIWIKRWKIFFITV